MAVGDYTLEVDLNDPSLSVTASYIIKIGVVPASVFNLTMDTSSGSINGVMLNINQTGNPSNGWYIIIGYNFTQWQGSGNGTITQPLEINRRNALTSVTTGTCPSTGTWLFAASETAVKSLFRNACGNAQPTETAVSNFTSYYYQIIQV